MTSLPTTAPRWTESDDRAERKSLTAEQIQDIDADLFGTNKNSNKPIKNSNDDNDNGVDAYTSDCSDLLLAKLESCLSEMSNSSKKKAELIQQQAMKPSEMLQFLAAVQLDPQRAAQQIVNYNEIRRKLFFKAMADTNAAIDYTFLQQEYPNVIQLLQMGVFQFLPNDKMGRTVLFYNRAVFRPQDFKQGHETLLRALFYMLNLASKKQQQSSPSSVISPGLVFIANFKYYDPAHFDRRTTRLLVQLLTNCMPVRVVGLHLCYATPKSAFELVLPTFKQIMGSYLRHRLVVHIGGDSDIAAALQSKYGILHVPKSLGGTIVWNDDSIACWLTDVDTTPATTSLLANSTGTADSLPGFAPPLPPPSAPAISPNFSKNIRKSLAQRPAAVSKSFSTNQLFKSPRQISPKRSSGSLLSRSSISSTPSSVNLLRSPQPTRSPSTQNPFMTGDKMSPSLKSPKLFSHVSHAA